MASAIARFKGQHISQEEIGSVAYFIDKFLLSSSLLNDLYSFHKEFDDHITTGNVNTIGNSMVVLMSSYGYTEDEAASILKKEIQALEVQALEEFHSWQDSNLIKARNLVGYSVTVVNMVGGINYWMSHSERYFRANLRTTAEDRARLVADAPVLRHLENHPAPLAMKGHATTTSLDPTPRDDDSGSNSASMDFIRMASEHMLSDRNGCKDIATSITAPFRKADAEKVHYNVQVGRIVTNKLNRFAWHHMTT